MPDADTPVVEKTTQIAGVTETTKATTETAAAAVISPPPAVIADDWIRKVMAIGIILQFTLYIGLITLLLVYMGKELSQTANNIIMIILTAEIGYMGLAFNYYMGSSSGSTAKSALLEKK
jgi:hypothetical protein